MQKFENNDLQFSVHSQKLKPMSRLQAGVHKAIFENSVGQAVCHEYIYNFISMDFCETIKN